MDIFHFYGNSDDNIIQLYNQIHCVYKCTLTTNIIDLKYHLVISKLSQI